MGCLSLCVLRGQIMCVEKQIQVYKDISDVFVTHYLPSAGNCEVKLK